MHKQKKEYSNLPNGSCLCIGTILYNSYFLYWYVQIFLITKSNIIALVNWTWNTANTHTLKISRPRTEKKNANLLDLLNYLNYVIPTYWSKNYQVISSIAVGIRTFNVPACTLSFLYLFEVFFNNFFLRSYLYILLGWLHDIIKERQAT